MQATCLPLLLAEESVGSSNDARIMIIEITTRISNRVKASREASSIASRRHMTLFPFSYPVLAPTRELCVSRHTRVFVARPREGSDNGEGYTQRGPNR